MSDLHHLRRNMSKIYRQSEDVSWQSPHIMQKRITMLMQQNAFNDSKTLHEAEQMVSEKAMAFVESWQNMGWQTLIAQQHIGNLLFDNWLKIAFGKPIAVDQFFYQVNLETLKILEKGMYPIHRRVVANAKRLK